MDQPVQNHLSASSLYHIRLITLTFIFILSLVALYTTLQAAQPTINAMSYVQPRMKKISKPVEWKTYVNEKLKFSIDYPSDMTIKEFDYPNQGELGGVSFMNNLADFSVTKGQVDNPGGPSKFFPYKTIRVDGTLVQIKMQLWCFNKGEGFDCDSVNPQNDQYSMAMILASLEKDKTPLWSFSTNYWQKGQRTLQNELSVFEKMLTSFQSSTSETIIPTSIPQH